MTRFFQTSKPISKKHAEIFSEKGIFKLKLISKKHAEIFSEKGIFKLKLASNFKCKVKDNYKKSVGSISMLCRSGLFCLLIKKVGKGKM